jgi:hypothetical protein
MSNPSSRIEDHIINHVQKKKLKKLKIQDSISNPNLFFWHLVVFLPLEIFSHMVAL